MLKFNREENKIENRIIEPSCMITPLPLPLPLPLSVGLSRNC